MLDTVGRYNKAVRAYPKYTTLWLEFVDFQEEVANAGGIGGKVCWG